MKDFISLSLQKGGKQSTLSMNKGEDYKGVGKVTNTHSVGVRVPINTRMRTGFIALKIHLLAVCGYLNDEIMSCYNFADGSFEVGAKSVDFLHATKLLQNLEVIYCYHNDGVISLKGNLRFLDSSKTLVLSTPKIGEDDDYEFYDHLEEDCEELSTASMDWYDNRKDIDNKQIAMSFMEIDQRLSKKDAEKLFDGMDESEKEEIIGRHMMKFVEQKENMSGEDTDGDFKTIPDEDKPSEKKEEPKGIEKLEKSAAEKAVAKQKASKAVKKLSPKVAPGKVVASKEVAPKSAAVENDDDPFSSEDIEENESNTIPQIV
jgi:hypothetical protein